MEVQGPGGVSGPRGIDPQKVTPQRAEGTEVPAKVGDRVEVSEVARLFDQLAEIPSVRMDKVAKLREEIASGQYETREKIEKAVEKLLEEL